MLILLEGGLAVLVSADWEGCWVVVDEADPSIVHCSQFEDHDADAISH